METIITLNNHTLLYDKDCPLCNLYTSTFINSKMLDKKGRKPYEDITSKERSYIDVKRAANEIALVDNTTKKVFYGIDSLLKVIGNSFPFFEKAGNIQPIHYVLRKLYSFISYNRKVIIPSEKKEDTILSCIPDFNLKYRLLYILLTTVISAYTLFCFFDLVVNLPRTNLKLTFILVLGQVVFQLLFLIKKDIKTSINYIGNLITVLLIGAIGLLQTIILNMIISLPKSITLIVLFGIVGLMFLEHKRRVNLLELPNNLKFTWGVYMLIASLIISNI